MRDVMEPKKSLSCSILYFCQQKRLSFQAFIQPTTLHMQTGEENTSAIELQPVASEVAEMSIVPRTSNHS